MKRGLRAGLVVTLALAMGSAWGCKALKKRAQQKAALEFNNKLADFNKRIRTDAKDLGVLVGKRISGKKVSDKALDDGLAKLKATVASVRKQTRALKVPDDPLAKELYSTYQKFLDGQERLVGKVEELVALAKSPIGAKGEGRAKMLRKVRPILQAVQKEEQASLKLLQSVQRRYAKKHNITLM